MSEHHRHTLAHTASKNWIARNVARLLVAGITALWSMSAAPAQQVQQPKLVVPPGPALAIMIINTLIAYNQGNATGNYSVLRDLASPQFRDTNSPVRLADVFREVRENGIDISPIVLFTPKLVREPEVDKDGDLILEGFFDTRPETVNFFLVFRAVQRMWKLFAIRVTTTIVPTGSMPSTILAPDPLKEQDTDRSRFDIFGPNDVLEPPNRLPTIPNVPEN